MDKVLIVEDNPVLLKILQSGLKKYNDRLAAITARDGEEAIEILEKESIALLVTDLQMPKVDGLTLLAYMNDQHPDIPCVVMSAHGTPQIKEKISRDVLRFIEKPFEIDELVDTILPALEEDEPAGTLNGISIANFLQMIHMEQKTCLLEIETPDDRKGYFYFEDGVLFDAVYEELIGEEAALAIIPRERAKIRFKNLAKGKKRVSRRINKDLMAVLMDAMRLEDEARAGSDAVVSESEYEQNLSSDGDGIFGEADTAGEIGEADGYAFDDEIDLLDLDGDDVKDDGPPEESPAAPEASHPAAVEPPPEKKAPPPADEYKREKVESDMASMLTGLRSVADYRGAAVLDEAGDILVQDVVERDLDMELFAAMVLDLIRSGRNFATETGFGAPRELILAADSGVLLCVSPASAAAASFHALVVMGPNGNRAMAKISLKKILPVLEVALA